jgi:hypothetical protein
LNALSLVLILSVMLNAGLAVTVLIESCDMDLLRELHTTHFFSMGIASPHLQRLCVTRSSLTWEASAITMRSSRPRTTTCGFESLELASSLSSLTTSWAHFEGTKQARVLRQ